jgi:hypothetical protein
MVARVLVSSLRPSGLLVARGPKSKLNSVKLASNGVYSQMNDQQHHIQWYTEPRLGKHGADLGGLEADLERLGADLGWGVFSLT